MDSLKSDGKHEILGGNDRVHGYNPVYQYLSQKNSNSDSVEDNGFKSFEFDGKSPGEFRFKLINIEYDNNIYKKIYDHQGHIIPQNTLCKVLKKFVGDIENHGVNNDETFKKFMNGNFAHQAYPWMKSVCEYGDKLKIPMFDWDATQMYEKIDNYLSIIIWNPINICRAPEDNVRFENRPGDKVDNEVIDWLYNNSNNKDLNISEKWLEALQAVKKHGWDNFDTVNKYIIECCNSLKDQRISGRGFYQLPWQHIVHRGVLVKT
jgi:hypothetical protein